MSKIILCLLAIAISLVPRPASAARFATVRNNSYTCAWVTIYTSSGPLERWKILETGFWRPEYLKPGEEASVDTGYEWQEYKVRAQYTRNADCSGGEIANHDVVKKNAHTVGSVNAKLVGRDRGSLRVTW